MRCMGNMCWCHYRSSRCSRCCRTSLGCGSADSGSAAEVAAAADSGYVACEDDADDADDADGAHVDCGCGNRSRSKWTLYSGVDCCHRHNSQAHNWKYRQNQHNKVATQHFALDRSAKRAATCAALRAGVVATPPWSACCKKRFSERKSTRFSFRFCRGDYCEVQVSHFCPYTQPCPMMPLACKPP